jgi:3-dehydroquinate dehydratase-2
MKKIVVINGPNINMLGVREKKVYGKVDYKELCKNLEAEAKKLKVGLLIFQSNSEGDIVDKIQSLLGKADAIVINPGAYTHTSIAIRDALSAVKTPFIEVHISNIFAREKFRAHSYLSDIAAGIVAGFGTEGYLIALRAAAGFGARAKGR